MEDIHLNKVFLFKLESTTKQFRKYKNRIFKEFNINITSDQWILLKNIHENEGINQTELSNLAKKEAASVTRTLDLLEKKNWVERKVDKNSRRVFQLFCTNKGNRMVEKILPLALKARARASKGLSTEEIKILNSLLDRIYKNLE